MEKREMSFTCLKEMSRFIWNCFPNDWSEVFDVCFFSTFSFYHSRCISILFWRQQSITFQKRTKRIKFILIMVLLKVNISKKVSYIINLLMRCFYSKYYKLYHLMKYLANHLGITTYLEIHQIEMRVQICIHS